MIPGANPLQYSASASAAAYAQMLGLAGFTQQQQSLAQHQAQASRANPYAAQAAALTAAYGQQGLQTSSSAKALTQAVNVKFKNLPFYDIHGELLKPTSLVTQGSSRFQEASFQFMLSPEQATNIASNRDIRMGSKLDYLYQIQLRFCQLDTSAEQGDEFPPSICVQVNGKMCTLPNPIPTNKPNVEPKRPPRPVHLTPLCKLTPTLNNVVNIKWAADYGKNWVVGIWLVEKLSSEQLMERLVKKGKRNSEYTRDLIKKLTDDDDGIATTNLKVTVSCPLGKMRMTTPCRPTTCDHLQCFDAALFLMMNEKKPTWICPVCDSPAKYEDLMVDGYFEEVIKSPLLPDEENEIILNQDGSWNPVPIDEEAERKRKEKEEEEKKDAVCLDLDSDDDDYAPAPKVEATEAAEGETNGEAPSPPPIDEEANAAAAALAATAPGAGVECIDID